MGVELSERDHGGFASKWAPNGDVRLGLFFVGLDVIGDYLTEINVTSPTCIRELDSLYNIDISAQLMRRFGKTQTGALTLFISTITSLTYR